MIHDLKCWPEYFQAVKSGVKPFEYRKDDRGYAVGDVLHLREYDPATLQYSGDAIDKTVTYVLPVARYGVGNDERYVIMGIAPRPDWTPCAEGLPTESGRYIVTIKRTAPGKEIEFTSERDFYANLSAGYRWEASAFAYDNIIAWMPKFKPEPYNPEHFVDVNKKIESKLVPCKKCGGEVEKFENRNDETHAIDFGIKCLNCGRSLTDTIFTKTKPTKFEWKMAEKAWNRRNANDHK